MTPINIDVLIVEHPSKLSDVQRLVGTRAAEERKTPLYQRALLAQRTRLGAILRFRHPSNYTKCLLDYLSRA